MTPASAETPINTLKVFTGQPDGSLPLNGLTLGGSTLYGTTRNGGATGWGTIFQINIDGTGYQRFFNFTGGDTAHGVPVGSLVYSGAKLFGVTDTGETGANTGSVYSINTDGTGYAVLHTFSSLTSGAYRPYSGLSLGASTLYGTTSSGGTAGQGTVYSVNTDGTGYQVVHNFAAGPDGYAPGAGLTIAGSTIYGMTDAGGSSDKGTIFSMNADGSNYTVLHSFLTSDGWRPGDLTSLTLVGSKLFGTTQLGDDVPSRGTIFSINTDGSEFKVLHNFATNVTEDPNSPLTLIGSTLYGTLANGESSYGVVYQINTDGTGYKILHDFAGNSPTNKSPSGQFALVGSTLFGTTQSDLQIPGPSGSIYSIQIPEPASFALAILSCLSCCPRRRR